MLSRNNNYGFSSWLFTRCIGIIYLIAFVSFFVQYEGLISQNGILPASRFLDSLHTNLGSRAYWLVPTINWLGSTDVFLYWQLVISILFSILLISGVLPFISSFVLWVSYLSIVKIGQGFMSFQWDVLLLEAGFLTILLSTLKIISRASDSRSPHILLIFLFKLLLFKLMFSSGVGKLLSGDETWRNLTALNYHYYTQPLPNPIAWHVHHLPHWIHKLSVAVMLFIEIVVPFFFFAPKRLRYIAAYLTIGLQVVIMVTGNYTFFNMLTIFLCIFLFDNAFFTKYTDSPKLLFATTHERRIKYLSLKTLSLSILVLLVSSITVIQFSSRYLGYRNIPGFLSPVLRTISSFHLLNTYGLFTVMTTKRNEIIIEGSNDGIEWKAYEFKYKPGDVKDGLSIVAPHQPRLDWQMWFAALGSYRQNPWFVNFMYKLQERSQPVLYLLKTNPFPESPPKYLRVQIYDYEFTYREQRNTTGNIWKRSYIGYYIPVFKTNN